jgi:hypothetical protein
MVLTDEKGAFHGSPRGCGLAAGRSGGFRPSCAARVQWHAAQFRRRSLGKARALDAIFQTLPLAKEAGVDPAQVMELVDLGE